MSLSKNRNHFELFQLPVEYRVDVSRLDQRFRELQACVHPDKVAHQGETEKRLALQWSTRVNEAFQILRNPLDRARYMVSLQGIDCDEESRTTMPPEFLLEQIEWRSELQEARTLRDMDRMGQLEHRLGQEMKILRDLLSSLLDGTPNYPAAAEVIRQLAFLDKLDRDMNQALAELEDD